MCAVGATFLEDSYQDPNTPVGPRGLKGALKGTLHQLATGSDSSQYQQDNTVNVFFSSPRTLVAWAFRVSLTRKSPPMMSNPSSDVIGGDFLVKETQKARTRED